MADYSAMPSRLYKLYHDKVRDMPSLRTDDIKGAQPRKQNYAKGDILDKYNIAKNQAPASQEPKNFVYWQPPEVNREEYQSKSYGSYAAAPYATNSPQKQNGYALPQDYRVPGLNQNILNNPQYQDKYASINQMRNPMFANYDYARQQQGQNGQNRNTVQQYQNGQYQDSLDNLSNRYGVQTQSTPNLHNPRTSAPSLNQPLSHLQSHPTFEKNLHMFFGIDHKKQPSNPQPNFQSNQGPRVSAPYQANPGVRTGATPQGSQVAHLQSHPTFEKNLHMFFGVDHKKQPSNPQPNFQANQGPRVSAPYHTNPGVRTGATPQSSQVAHLQSHPTFEKNLHMFFGVDNKASNNQSNSQNRMAPTTNAPLQNNQVNHLKGHPQFEKHLHAFFGVEKPETKLVSKTQPNLQNYPLNYVGRNPLTHNATLNHQRIF